MEGKVSWKIDETEVMMNAGDRVVLERDWGGQTPGPGMPLVYKLKEKVPFTWQDLSDDALVAVMENRAKIDVAAIGLDSPEKIGEAAAKVEAIVAEKTKAQKQAVKEEREDREDHDDREEELTTEETSMSESESQTASESDVTEEETTAQETTTQEITTEEVTPEETTTEEITTEETITEETTTEESTNEEPDPSVNGEYLYNAENELVFVYYEEGVNCTWVEDHYEWDRDFLNNNGYNTVQHTDPATGQPI